jgi:hypothetical protein
MRLGVANLVASADHGFYAACSYSLIKPRHTGTDRYGAFYRSALYPLLERINAYLLRWVRRKYKRLRGSRKARTAWNSAVRKRPRAFAHWAWVTHAPHGLVTRATRAV